jgi:hypothetical protein
MAGVGVCDGASADLIGSVFETAGAVFLGAGLELSWPAHCQPKKSATIKRRLPAMRRRRLREELGFMSGGGTSDNWVFVQYRQKIVL